MELTREQIAARLPHGAPMCMLDRVIQSDATHIECESAQFPNANHPLSTAAALSPILLVEYAAQACALHASLNQAALGVARPAYIGAIKDVEFVDSVQDFTEPLRIFADCLLSSEQGAIYTVAVMQHEQPKMTGRLTLSQP